MWAVFERLILTAFLVMAGGAKGSAAPQPDPSQLITVRGLLQCVDRTSRKEPATYNCTDRGNRFALETDQGQLFFFSQSDPRAGIFEDPRVRERRLQVIGVPLPDRFVEIVHLHSVEEDGLYRLYYRCDVCNITAFAPGPCWCCRDDFEFRRELESDPALTGEGADVKEP